MPILKTIAGRTAPTYFEITKVEYVRFGTTRAWRAQFNAWPDSEEPKKPGSQPSYTGTDAGVAMAVTADPFSAYEEAAVNTPGSNFYGGEIVADVQSYSSLEWARITQWGKVKIERDAYRAGGIDTPYGRFDSDLESIVNMIGAATIAAQMPESWSDQWILKDRSSITLSRAQLLEVGAIAATFRGGTYRRGDELYQAIQQAGTVETVRAITWSPGVA